MYIKVSQRFTSLQYFATVFHSFWNSEYFLYSIVKVESYSDTWSYAKLYKSKLCLCKHGSHYINTINEFTILKMTEL